MTTLKVNVKKQNDLNQNSSVALKLDWRICGYCANRLCDVHEPCSAEGLYRHFIPKPIGDWKEVPHPVAYAEIMKLPAHVVRALYYRDIWYVVHKIRSTDGYFE